MPVNERTAAEPNIYARAAATPQGGGFFGAAGCISTLILMAVVCLGMIWLLARMGS